MSRSGSGRVRYVLLVSCRILCRLAGQLDRQPAGLSTGLSLHRAIYDTDADADPVRRRV